MARHGGTQAGRTGHPAQKAPHGLAALRKTPAAFLKNAVFILPRVPEECPLRQIKDSGPGCLLDSAVCPEAGIFPGDCPARRTVVVCARPCPASGTFVPASPEQVVVGVDIAVGPDLVIQQEVSR